MDKKKIGQIIALLVAGLSLIGGLVTTWCILRKVHRTLAEMFHGIMSDSYEEEEEKIVEVETGE